MKFKGLLITPRVDIYSFKHGEDFESALFKHIAEFPHPALLVTLNQSFEQDPGFCNYENAETPKGERWCWVDRRIIHIAFKNPEELEKHKGHLNLELMSPWQNQELNFILPGWKKSIKLDDSTAGYWQTVKVDFPIETLKKQKGFVFQVTQIHSPLAYKISTDRRRLGVAVRGINF